MRGQSAEPSPPPSHTLGAGPSLSRGAGEGLAAEPANLSTAGPLAVATQPVTAEQMPESAPIAQFDPMPQSFAEVVALFDQRREAVIRTHLWAHVHLVTFEPGRIEFRPEAAAPRDLANRLGQLLGEWTGSRWVITVSQAEGAPTLAEQEAQRASEVRNEVAGHPLVRAVLDTFPGATIAAVRDRSAPTEPAAEEDGIDENGVEEDGASAGEEGS